MIHEQIVPAPLWKDYVKSAFPLAFLSLPPALESKDAWRFLIAIALQEGRFDVRMQYGGGPARGWFQFERIGVAEVALNRHSKRLLQDSLSGLGLAPLAEALNGPVAVRNDAIDTLYQGLAFSESVAVVVARLALWRLPKALPGESDVEGAWVQYAVDIWRPGKPHRETWNSCWEYACKLVDEIF